MVVTTELTGKGYVGDRTMVSNKGLPVETFGITKEMRWLRCIETDHKFQKILNLSSTKRSVNREISIELRLEKVFQKCLGESILNK